MYETHQELIRRQQNKPEKNYIELTPGMPVWVQHRQNTSWEPATVVSQCNSNSYWIMQENGTDQPEVYRRTRTMPKIRCTNVRETRHSYSQSTESEKAKFQTPSTYHFKLQLLPMQQETVLSTILQKMYHRTLSTQLNWTLKLLLLLILNQKKGRKSQKLQMYLHLHLHPHLHLHLHWRESRNSPTLQDPESQQERTLEGRPVHLVTFTFNDHEDTRVSGLMDYQSEKLNFALYVLYSRAK